MNKIELTHEGEDYIKVEIDDIEYEVSKSIGIHIQQSIISLRDLVTKNKLS